MSPCYLNIHDPLEIGGFGEGALPDLARAVDYADDLGLRCDRRLPGRSRQ